MCGCFQRRRVRHNENYVPYAQTPACQVRNFHCDVAYTSPLKTNTHRRLGRYSLTLDCNGVFAIREACRSGSLYHRSRVVPGLLELLPSFLRARLSAAAVNSFSSLVLRCPFSELHLCGQLHGPTRTVWMLTPFMSPVQTSLYRRCERHVVLLANVKPT